MRDRDLSFESLAGVCGLDFSNLQGSARGALNKALAEIRSYHPDLTDGELAMVIEGKASTYRQVMEGAMLTPTALAKHWPQLESLAAEQQRQAPRINAPIDPSNCDHCHGHRQVLVCYRPAPNPHPDHGGPTSGFEEYLPCEFCNKTGLAIVLEENERFKRIHGNYAKTPPKGALESLGKVVGV